MPSCAPRMAVCSTRRPESRLVAVPRMMFRQPPRMVSSMKVMFLTLKEREALSLAEVVVPGPMVEPDPAVAEAGLSMLQWRKAMFSVGPLKQMVWQPLVAVLRMVTWLKVTLLMLFSCTAPMEPA